MIPQGRNPKGIGLFLWAALNLYEKRKDPSLLQAVEDFVGWLERNAAMGYSGKCWGYNFDWQSRAFFVPRGTPTIVNTCFVGRALVRAYEVMGGPEYLDLARSSCEFILKDLNRFNEDRSVAFSYTPLDHYFVNNATALAASLLGKVYSKTKEKLLADTAKKAAGYVLSRQRENGSWNYAEDRVGRRVGIDNFHTGFILESLKTCAESTGDNDCQTPIQKGLDFYQDHFFLATGAPRYFSDKTYPLDIHCASQAVITLIGLREYGSDMGLCQKTVRWMIENMQDKDGYFYYQKNRFYTNKIPYMRWAQAWAFRALAEYSVLS
jgi:rhamnogalacturonyl hydrolase YesR